MFYKYLVSTDIESYSHQQLELRPLSENSVGSGFFYHRTLVPRLRNRTGSSVNLQKRKKNKQKRKKKVVKTIL